MIDPNEIRRLVAVWKSCPIGSEESAEAYQTLALYLAFWADEIAAALERAR
jgi:hypothetical protein